MEEGRKKIRIRVRRKKRRKVYIKERVHCKDFIGKFFIALIKVISSPFCKGVSILNKETSRF